jgi:hypothetical protein
MRGRTSRGWLGPLQGAWSGLVPLFASFVAVGCASPPRPPCVEQSNAALREIADGTLERGAPGVAAWEREQAKACGWVLPEDFADPD